MENLNKINDILANEELTEKMKNEARNRFFLIIENDEIKTADDAYEFGRIWQSNCFEVNADFEDYVNTAAYLQKLAKRFENDKELVETFEEELGIELE